MLGVTLLYVMAGISLFSDSNGLVPVHQLMAILLPNFQTHVSVEFCNQIILASKFLVFNLGSYPGISHGWHSNR